MSEAAVPPLLEVKDLVVNARSSPGLSIPILRGVSFAIGQGEAVAVVGESGSGKSMTCAAIMRLFPSTALSIGGGEITFEGENLATKGRRAMERIRGRRIAMVVQDSLAALNPLLSVGHQVDESLRYHSSLGRRERRRRAVELFQNVGIPAAESRLGEYPHQFSGGMRQRVVAAIALALEPSLIIADEPTTALDPTVAVRVLGMLSRVQTEHGAALLFVTHDIGLARRLCSRIVVMYGGRVVEQGPTEAVLRSPSHPYTQALTSCLPSAASEPMSVLPEIPGEPPGPGQLKEHGCSFAPRCPAVEARCHVEDPPNVVNGARSFECWNPLESQPCDDGGR